MTPRGSRIAWHDHGHVGVRTGDAGRRRGHGPPALPQPAGQRRGRRAQRHRCSATSPAPSTAAARGRQLHRNGWLPSGAARLQGNNSHAYSDVNDNNKASVSEEVHPHRQAATAQALQAQGMSFCKQPPCSWNPNKPFSWKTNRAQNATQVFYFVNTGTTTCWPSRSASPRPPATSRTSTTKPARPTTPSTPRPTTAPTPPTASPTATTSTTPTWARRPTARRRRCRCTCSTCRARRTPTATRSRPTNTGDEADTVYHEYTHGLSNRLVVDVQGQLHPRRRSRPARWARPGATGTPWTTS